MIAEEFARWLLDRGLMQSSDPREGSPFRPGELGVHATDEAIRLVAGHTVEGVEVGFVVFAYPWQISCGEEHQGGCQQQSLFHT